MEYKPFTIQGLIHDIDQRMQEIRPALDEYEMLERALEITKQQQELNEKDNNAPPRKEEETKEEKVPERRTPEGKA